MNQPEQFISAPEAARLCGYSAEHVRRLCASGKIKAHKVGKTWLTTEAEVRGYLEPSLSQPLNLAEVNPAGFSYLPTGQAGFSKKAKLAAAAVCLTLALPAAAAIFNLPDKLVGFKTQYEEIVAGTFRKFTNQDPDDDKLDRILSLLEERESGQVAGQSVDITIPTEAKRSGGIPSQSDFSLITRNGKDTIPLQPQVLGISNSEIIAAFRATLQEGLPEDILIQLKGDKGDIGPIGPTSQYIPNSGSVFGTTAPTASYNSVGTIGSATFLSGKQVTAETLTVTQNFTIASSVPSVFEGNLTVKGNTTLGDNVADIVTISGNTGIGTTNPQYPLHVVGDIASQDSGFFAYSNTATTGPRRAFTSQNDLGKYVQMEIRGSAETCTYFGLTCGNLAYIRTPNAAALAVGTDGNSPFVLGTNNLERIRIDTSGNVGIGTTIPANTLSVKGTFGVVATSTTFSATGGTVTTSGGNTIHTFTSSGTFTPNGATTVDVLVVGGGGGGGGARTASSIGDGGGGGAGGFISTTYTVSNTPIKVTVGAGGVGGGASGVDASNGSDSIFGTVVAKGGGRGGGYSPLCTCSFGAQGGAGGSGGGAGYSAASSGGAGTSGQGNNGGANSQNVGPNYGEGGGGGASGAGANGTGTTGGNGGAGTASSISGSSVTYAGGGGGGVANGATAGTGGAGGGGAGSNSNSTGTAGTANTGGGGGGGGNSGSGSSTGGAGGSGVVIVRYSTAASVAPQSIIADTSGNSGIGTATAATRFQIAGDLSITGGGSGLGVLTFGDTSSFNTGIYRTNYGGGTDALNIQGLYRIIFNTGSFDAPTEGMRIEGNSILGGTSNNSPFFIRTESKAGDSSSYLSLGGGDANQSQASGPYINLFGNGSPGGAPGSIYIIPGNISTAGTFIFNGAGAVTFAVNAADNRIGLGRTVEPNIAVAIKGSTTDSSERTVRVWNPYDDNNSRVLINFNRKAAEDEVGNISATNTTTTYATSSDRRLKENVADTMMGLDALRQIKVRDYNFIADPSKRLQGFIAQELYDVYPEAVYAPEDPNKYWGVDYGKLSPLLVQAIQDLDSKTSAVYATSDTTIGDVVKLSGPNQIAKAAAADTAIGIVSQANRISFAGQLKVKISEENGQIHAGDKLIVSTLLPGYAAKMTESGQSIGTALEDSSGGAEGLGTVMAFIDIGYHKVEVTQSSSGQLVTIENDIDMSGFALLNVKAIASLSGKWSIDENGTIVVVNIKAQKGEFEQLEVKNPDQTKTGITIYDRVSGTPVCVYSENNILKSESGECGIVAGAVTPPVEETPPAEEESPPVEPTPEPQPEPAPEVIP